MNRRLFLCTILCIGIASEAVAFSDHDHGEHGNRRGDDHGRNDNDDEVPRPPRIPVRYFRAEDRVLLSRYYPTSTLPPGLKKKYVRTGTIPPGWEKRLQPLPVAVVEHLPPPPPNCERAYVDGYAVLYNRTTRVILDTVDLISALSGR